MLTISMAIVGFYVLDFGINAVQASCRSLIIDVLPTAQQHLGNSYASAMIACGNVIGFLMCVYVTSNGDCAGDTLI
jgi:solute carrier family 45 protein 1/2/4